MVTRLSAVCLLGAFVYAQACPADVARRTYTPVQYLKNYALSTCLADGFASDEVVKDAAAAARAYLEFGDLPIEAYTEATKLGRTFLAREYASQAGQKLVLMKCIDFFHSKELERLARRYVGKR